MILLFGLLVTSGCANQSLANTITVTPTTTGIATTQSAALAGDPGRGEVLFRKGKSNAPACIGCHALAPGGFSLGPVMKDVAPRVSNRVPGMGAVEYIRQSILEPLVYVVPGFRPTMYPKYRESLTDQEIEDLIAFVLQR